MEQKKLNAVYSSGEMKRPYEVWFSRCGMADGSGAWWFRYLVMHLGRGSWGAPTAQPAQVWATWFPRDGERCSFIHGFPIETLRLSERRTLPFYCRIADKGIEGEFAGAICGWRDTRFRGSCAGSRILA